MIRTKRAKLEDKPSTEPDNPEDIIEYWNKKDLSQFKILDRDGSGWKTEVITSGGDLPPHIKIRSPGKDAKGPLFIIFNEEIDICDYTVKTIFSFDGSTLKIGPTARFIDYKEYVSCCFDNIFSEKIMCNVYEGNIASPVAEQRNLRIHPKFMKLSLSCNYGMYGIGLGDPYLYGARAPVADNDIFGPGRAGLCIESLYSHKDDGDVIRVFDIRVENNA